MSEHQTIGGADNHSIDAPDQKDGPKQQDPKEPDPQLQQSGQAAANASLRDNRKMSGLALAGLIVGVSLLAFTVLIGMVPFLSYSLVLQDDLIRTLLFCISVGLILAALGDYAFISEKTFNRVYTIGGASAIAAILFILLRLQSVEQVFSARVRFVKDVVVKSVYLLTADSSEYEGRVDPQYTQANMFRFRVPQSVAEQLTHDCFTIAIATERNRQSFKVFGANARLPQSVAYVFDFSYDGNQNALVRQTREGSIQDLPKCGAPVFQDAPPTQKQIQTTATVTPPDKPTDVTRVGWTFYGKRDGRAWEQRVYNNTTRSKDDEPRTNDNAEVISDVFLRPDPRKCRSEDDCDKLSPDIGIVKIGSLVKIL